MVSSSNKISTAANLYEGKCSGCTTSYGDSNCAHHTSNAMALAGINILERSSDSRHPASKIKARCPGGRTIRAKELRDWWVAAGYKEYDKRPPLGTAAFFYIQRDSDSQGHVGLINTNGECRDTAWETGRKNADLGGDWRKYYY